jgi:hypothetical protein
MDKTRMDVVSDQRAYLILAQFLFNNNKATLVDVYSSKMF